MDTTSIYALVDPRDDVVRYVGQSQNLASRLSQHMSAPGARRKSWIAELRALGLKPKVLVLETVAAGPKADAAERKWIERHKATVFNHPRASTRGRPRKYPGQDTQRFAFMVQPGMAAEVRAAARREGQTISEWLMRAAREELDRSRLPGEVDLGQPNGPADPTPTLTRIEAPRGDPDAPRY